MFDHLGIRVKDYPKAKAFYQAALAPLGYEIILEFTEKDDIDYQGAGFGIGRKPDFWIGKGKPNGPIHVAFSAADRKTVGDAFHAAGLAAGGTDNGPPGVRKEYHPMYYGAFVVDPDGNNIEAVCHKPP